MANFSTDWPFWLAATLLALLSAFILYRSLLHNRSRGRRRCPKCWYDMSGVNGLRCPECGRDAKRERKLFRTRRRWGWAAAALALALLSYGLWKTPEVRRHGWPRAIPTWALIAALDVLEDPTLAERDAMGKKLPVPVTIRLGWDLITRCHDNGAGMWAWERAWLISRCMASPVGTAPYSLGEDGSALGLRVFCLYSLNGWGVGEDDLLPPSVLAELRRRVAERAVVTRARWPENVPVQVKLARDTWFGYGNVMFGEIRARPTDPRHAEWVSAWLWGYSGPWNDVAQRIGLYPAGVRSVEFDLALVDLQPERRTGGVRPQNECWEDEYLLESSMWEATTSVTFEVGGAIHDVMTAVPSNAVTTRIATIWTVRLDRLRITRPYSWDVATLHIRDQPHYQPYTTASLIPNTTLALWIEIQRNGRTIGWTQAWWRDSILTSGYDGLHDGVVSSELRVEVISDEMFLPDAPDDKWTVRIYGDAKTALRDFESTRYWEGFVERPLNVTPVRMDR